jgi:hypothetical protein
MMRATIGVWLVMGCSAAAVSQEAEPGAAPAEATPKLAVGMNVSRVTPDNHEWVFVDVMKRSDGWRYLEDLGRRPLSDGRPAGKPVPEDEHGWPLPAEGKTVVTRLFLRMDGHYPAGEYVCTWKGKGQVDVRKAGRVTKKEPNRLLVDVVPSRGELHVSIQDSDPTDPVRDVRLWMPGFEDAESPFHPMWVERLRPFAALRFSNWSCVYSNDGVWENRPLVTDARQTSNNGVALEYMIEACNVVGADPWFTMPHLADDEYVRSFATLVKERLDPERRIYVEWSNETWNRIFPQGKWTIAQSRQQRKHHGAIHAEEALRDFRVWHEVFGDDKDRVVRIGSGHANDVSVARAVLGGLGDEVDAIAIAPYFGVRAERQGLTMQSTADDIVAAARTHLTQKIIPAVRRHGELVAEHSEVTGRHVALLAYEAGQSIRARAGSPAPNAPRRLVLSLEATYAAQTHPEMGAAYRELLSGCRDAGMELLMAFIYVRRLEPGGCWGVLRYQDDPLEGAVKYRALAEPVPDGSPPEPAPSKDE